MKNYESPTIDFIEGYETEAGAEAPLNAVKEE